MNHREYEPLAYDAQTLAEYASGSRPMSAATARDIEARLGLACGWLDAEHGDASPQQRY